MHYLVTEYTYFVDPHGTPDLGKEKKFITEDSRYQSMTSDDDQMYWDGEEFVHEDDLRGSEDGYNRTIYQYTVRELNDFDKAEVERILKAYNEL